MSRKFKLLGTILFEADGQPMPIMNSRKGCALLAYLIVKKEAQSRESVAELLWDSSSTTQSLTRLRVLLSRIQKQLPELIVTRNTLCFEPTPETAVDLYDLQNALATKEIIQLEEGLALYQGQLLENFYLEEPYDFNEWLAIERENLNKQVVTTFRHLCLSFREQNLPLKGLEIARSWLSHDRLDEDALRHLMQFLADTGQTSVALEEYLTSRQLLWNELGVEPSLQTVQLAEALSKQPVNIAKTIQLPQRNELSNVGFLPPLSTIPFQRNNDFMGREAPLLFLANALLPWPDASDTYKQTVAITGMGGVGKTQLAVEFCFRYARYFPGGVFWLNFMDEKSIAEEVAQIGGEKGMGLFRDADQFSLNDRVGQVQKALQDNVPRLLIFDNCEEEALLNQWIPKTGATRVLITSRRAHWSRELKISTWPLGVFYVEESIRFLQNVAEHLTESEATAVAEEIGHLPLALHLAGAFLSRYKQVSVVDYIIQLRNFGLLNHPSLQGRGTTYSPTGHELHVAKTFAINLSQLNSDDLEDRLAKDLLKFSACFAPSEPIPRSLLLQIIDIDPNDLEQLLTSEDSLQKLVTLGFLENRKNNRVIIHPLIVAFTNEALGDSKTPLKVEQAIIRYFAMQKEDLGDLGVLPISITHLRLITNNAFNRGKDVAYRLGLLLGAHAREIGELTEARSYLRKTVVEAETVHDLQCQAEAWVLLARAQNNVEERLACAEQAEKIIRNSKLNDSDLLASALREKGWANFQLGQVNRAKQAGEEAKSLTQSHSKGTTYGSILNLLAVLAYHSFGEYAIAETYQKEAYQIFKSVGNRYIMGILLNNMAENARLQGDFKNAILLYQKGIALAQEIGNRRTEWNHRINLAGAFVGEGLYRDSEDELELLLLTSTEDLRLHSELFLFLGEAKLGLGKVQEALEHIQTGYQLATHTTKIIYDEGHAWRLFAEISAILNQPVRITKSDTNTYSASQCFEHSISIFETLGSLRDKAIVLWKWGLLEFKQGKMTQSDVLLMEAKSLFNTLNLPRFVAIVEESEQALKTLS